MRIINPAKKYFLATRSVHPLSRKFGFDRGTPIDRFWIESFLTKHKGVVRGVCLEVGDNRYTKQFGSNVKKTDILDISKKNKQATIVADLQKLEKVKSNTYDCVILTHVLGMVQNIDAAISEVHRILKPQGVLLVTVSSFGPMSSGIKHNYWRLTVPSAKYLFGKRFSSLVVTSYGNVLAGQCFWVGLAQEELTQSELEFNDPNYPCVITVYARK